MISVQSHCNKYPFLFHKQSLGMFPKEQCLNKIYKIMRTLNKSIESPQSSQHHLVIAHLHCYDINKFNEFYGEYNSQIFKHCSAVIITYTINSNCTKMRYTTN